MLARSTVRRPSRGFTLVEVVTVLVCLAVLTAGGAGVYASLTEARSRSAMREITSMIETAKRMSRARSVSFEIVFDVDEQVCGVRRTGTSRWQQALAGGRPLFMQLSSDETGGLAMTSAGIPGGRTLRFDSHGIPAGPASIDLKDSSKRSFRITITRTGLVSWSNS